MSTGTDPVILRRIEAYKEVDELLAAYPPLGEWADRRACADYDDSYFFTSNTGAGHLRARKAVAVCAGCEVRAECLSYALAVPALKGIWGGMGEKGRQRLRARLRAEQGEAA